jgi:hypothetical protein
MTAPSLPELNRENAAPGTSLRSYQVTFGEKEITAYVGRTGETVDAYRTNRGVNVPPGLLMACYGRLIHETFFYQTGVHVSSNMKIHRLPVQGDPLEVTGQVLDLFSHNGNEYVKFSVNVASAAGEPLAEIEHVSIYKFKARNERE